MYLKEAYTRNKPYIHNLNTYHGSCKPAWLPFRQEGRSVFWPGWC